MTALASNINNNKHEYEYEREREMICARNARSTVSYQNHSSTTMEEDHASFPCAFVTKPSHELICESEEDETNASDSDTCDYENDEETDEENECPASTLLLRKNRELDLVAKKLRETVEECEKTTLRLDLRERDLLIEQDALHADCAKFETFARENERKMQKAMENARKSKAERLALEVEVLLKLRREASSFGRRRKRCEWKNRALSSVLMFLQRCCSNNNSASAFASSSSSSLSLSTKTTNIGTVTATAKDNSSNSTSDVAFSEGASNDGVLRFEEISDILSRHATLRDVNDALVLRKDYACNESRDTFLRIAQERKEIDRTLACEREVICELRKKKKLSKDDSKREIAIAKENIQKRKVVEKKLALSYGAIGNLWNRCVMNSPLSAQAKSEHLAMASSNDEEEKDALLKMKKMKANKLYAAQENLDFILSRAKVLNKIILNPE